MADQIIVSTKKNSTSEYEDDYDLQFWHKYTNSNIDFNQIINSEDYQYAKKIDGEKGTSYGLVMIILTLACLIVILVNIFHLIMRKKYKQSAVYELLLHFFLFLLFIVLTACVEALSSILTEKTYYHLRRTKWICIFTSYIPFALESCNIFQLLLIWLILMSERNLTGLKCLYNDYRLKKIETGNSQPRDIEAGVSNSSQSPTSRADSSPSTLSQEEIVELNGLKANTTKNFLNVHSRSIILYSFYFMVFLITAQLSSSSYTITYFHHPICALDSYALLSFVMLLSMPLFFIPLLYMFLLVPTLFGNFFGGERDPLLKELTDQEKKLLKFIKIASFLRTIDEFLMHIHSSSVFMYDASLQKSARSFGMFMYLITCILFVYFEELLSDNCFKRANRPPTSSNVIVKTRDRVRNLIFKKSGIETEVNEEVVDYRQLVESGDEN
jgi:hypothetical protein